MFQKVMKELHLPFKPLVAFSGTVKDPDSGKEYTENSMNELGVRVSIPDAYKTPDFRILIVANKFQTGFDEPLLHTMYVDKKLGGVQAVQTLSRLNRTMVGKSETIVMDFVNDSEKIQEAFQPYYQTTILEDETDPNKLYDIRTELEKFEVYTEDDINDFVKIFLNPREKAEKFQPILDRVVNHWNGKQEDDREEFRSILQSYIRMYGFISQLITFEDKDLEKLYIFGKNLLKKLPKHKSDLPFEVTDAVDLDSFRIQQTFIGKIILDGEQEIAGLGMGKRQSMDDEKDLLSNIIKVLNDSYGINLTDEDKIDLERIQIKLESDEKLKEYLTSKNSINDIRLKFDEAVDNILMEFVNNKVELFQKMSKPNVNKMFKNKMFDSYYKQDRR